MNYEIIYTSQITIYHENINDIHNHSNVCMIMKTSKQDYIQIADISKEINNINNF